MTRLLNMDLFNNQIVNNALKALTPEQKEYYKKIGENLYGKVNFTDSEFLTLEKQKEESLAYIIDGLKSGLHPKELNEDEIELLTAELGDKWYEKYGYSREEVPESGLSLKLKKKMEQDLKQYLEKNNK